MPKRLEAQLIGYLLNAMEEEEREQLEVQLAVRPGLRRRLARLKAFFEILDKTREEFLPPPDLVRRTCLLVQRDRFTCPSAPSYQAEADAGSAVAQRPRKRLEARSAGLGFRWAPLGDYWAGERTSWSILDLLASCVVILLLIALLLPALVETRFYHHVATCRENLHGLYAALSDYQNIHPEIQFAGGMPHERVMLTVVLPHLQDFGYDSQKCPGWVGTEGERGEGVGNSPIARWTLQQGYTPVAFPKSLSLMDARPASDPFTVIWRDARVATNCGSRSWNHWGRGENWLFADGHVRFMPQSALVMWEQGPIVSSADLTPRD